MSPTRLRCRPCPTSSRAPWRCDPRRRQSRGESRRRRTGTTSTLHQRVRPARGGPPRTRARSPSRRRDRCVCPQRSEGTRRRRPRRLRGGTPPEVSACWTQNRSWSGGTAAYLLDGCRHRPAWRLLDPPVRGSCMSPCSGPRSGGCLTRTRTCRRRSPVGFASSRRAYRRKALTTSGPGARSRREERGIGRCRSERASSA